MFVGRNANGNPVQAQRGFYGGTRAADAELAKMVAKAASGKLTASRGTVEESLHAFIDHAKSRGRAETTINEYARIAKTTTTPAIGSIKVDKLTARELDRLYSDLTGRDLKPTSVRRVHALISAALHQSEKWGDVDSSVARKATPPTIHANEVTAPTVEQVRDLIRTAEGRDPTMATLVTLAALTGARLGELCGLRWSDWDEDAATLRIARSVFRTADGSRRVKNTKPIRCGPSGSTRSPRSR